MATRVKTSPRGFRPPVTVQQWCELEGPPHYELVDGNLLEKAAVAFPRLKIPLRKVWPTDFVNAADE